VVVEARQEILRIASLLAGCSYLFFTLVLLHNWFVSTFPLGLVAVEEMVWLLVPCDLGLGLALLAVALLFLSSAYWGLGEAKGVASLLMACVVGLSLLVLQLLICIANIADVGVLVVLIGEEADYSVVEDLLRPDVVLGLLPLALFPSSWKSCKLLIKASSVSGVGSQKRLT